MHSLLAHGILTSIIMKSCNYTVSKKKIWLLSLFIMLWNSSTFMHVATRTFIPPYPIPFSARPPPLPSGNLHTVFCVYEGFVVVCGFCFCFALSLHLLHQHATTLPSDSCQSLLYTHCLN